MKFQILTLKIAFLLLTFIKILNAQEILVPVHEGTNMASSLSPDGKLIAIDIQGTIGVVPAAGGTATLLTDGMGDERQPAWSPDGERIIFQSYRDGNYHVWGVRKDGSDLRQITFGMFDDREPHYSADGTRIAFASDRSGNYDIWELTLATGQLRQVTSNIANDFNPAYSPDGKEIAFVSVREKGGIMKINLTGEEKLIVPTNPNGTFNAPSWSPSGLKISFTSFFKAKSQLMIVDVSNGVVSTWSDNKDDVFPFRASWISDTEIIYTADGTINRKTLNKLPAKPIIFTATLRVSPPHYSQRQRDFDGEQPRKALGIFGPVVSPDGNSTAFTALSDIWLLKHGEAKPIQLTKDAAVDIDPAWSSDGKMMAFSSDRAGGNMNIWLHDFQNGTDKQVTKLDRHALQPSISPDGKKIAFIFNDGVLGFGTSTLHVLDLSTGSIKPLHKPLFTPGKPTWSADSKVIALAALDPYSSRYREGVTRVLYVPENGDPARFFSPVESRPLGQRGKNGPVWSPDGSKLAYIQDAVLWVVQIDKSGQSIHAPRRLTAELAEAPSWTGDSGSLVYLATDKLKKIFLSDGRSENIPLDLQWKIQKNTDKVIIHAGQLFDGKNSTYQKNVDLIIEGNRIKEIVPHRDHGSATVVDAAGKTLIPGIVEMHTHQNGSAGEMAGRNWLAYGITSVRETGGDPYDALERKEAWSSGVRPGPREFFTGPLLEGGRVYYELATSVSTPLQLDLELQRAAALEYDFIKTYVRFPDYFQRRAAAFAHEHGIPVSSHEIFPATSYGVDAVEHISATSRRGYSPKLTVMNRNYEDVVQILAKSGMNMTPTIALSGGFYHSWQLDPAILKNKQLNALYSKNYIDKVSEYTRQAITYSEENGDRYQELEKTFFKMFKAGVHLTAGTDSPFITYGLSLHVEMQNFVAAGMTPFQALQSSTLFAARALGVEKDLGTLEAGKLADLVIVNGDPLKDIHDAWNVEIVFKNGIRYSIDELLKSK